VNRNIRHLHTAVCIATIYLAIIGVAEVKAGTDLLATAVDRNEYFAGSGDVRLLRANGPYGTNGTYATVGLLNLLFLEFVRRNTSNEITGWRRSMHWAAIACACTVALLPMFRALALTATVVAAVALYQRYGKKSFLPVLGTVALLILFVLTLKTASPSLFEERVSDASNFHARLAEYKQGLALFSDHPFFGVGLNQFYASVADRFKYLFYYKGESSLDFPHSLPLALLAETGTIGFLSFVAAQATMLMGFRQLLTYRRTVRGYWAWNFTMLIFLTYCGMNVDLVSGYYDELNVWYLFVLAVVVKYGIQQLPPSASRKQAVRRFIQQSVPPRTVHL
jgi:O-antigen ligase